MDKRLMKLHENGQRHPGKTDWEKIALSGGKPASDEENPVLVYKKVFKNLKTGYGVRARTKSIPNSSFFLAPPRLHTKTVSGTIS